MIIIPMAGESKRFRNEGYLQPKYMLTLDGKPLFDWTVLSFRKYFSVELFLFIAQNSPENKLFLTNRIHSLGIKHFYCIFVDNVTRGQAETVYIGLQALINNGISIDHEPITIFNIDTIRPNIVFPDNHGEHSWLEVFIGQGDNWSFVLPEPNGSQFVMRCAEKKRISDYCSTGLYSFKDYSQFNRAYQKELNNFSSYELFIAPIYNHLISNGERVSWYSVDSSQVYLSGVPKEYEQLNFLKLTDLFQ